MDQNMSVVRVERRKDIGVILIDNPPINAGSKTVRQGLLAAISELSADAEIRGCIIAGADKMFMAGSDIREFGAPLEEPQLPAVIAAIEASTKPFAAAIAGAALGGGYELALGCDLRIAREDAVLGLPETTLGIMPGAGGTQRLPRLVDQAKSIELICSGTRLKAAEAVKLGMIDELSKGELIADAISALRNLIPRKRRVIEMPVKISTPEQIEKAKSAAIKTGKGRPHILSAVAAVETCGQPNAQEGLRRERAEFQRLRMSREAAALRHLFFAERANSKIKLLEGVTARPSRNIAVVGGGTMGSGIACSCLDGGRTVLVFEKSVELAEGAKSRILKNLNARVERGRLKPEKLAEYLARLSFTSNMADLASADVIVEAVFEEIGVKRDVFAALGRVAKPGAVLLTNTSYLSVSEIAKASGRAQDVAGMHYFSPADVMRLVEVVRHDDVAGDVLATAFALAKDCGKMPVLANDAFGFIGNRIYAAYRRQCEFMLEEGALPEEIDKALEEFGFAMGPFAVADMSGLDIAWNMRKATAARRDPKARYVRIPDMLCERGRLGRKTGAGYYRYVDGIRQMDPEVSALIEEASREAGIERRKIGDSEIVDRVLSAMASEAALLIDEGVANNPTDVDLVLTTGYGFPKHEGGPLFWARQLPVSELEHCFTRLAQVGGHGYHIGSIAILREQH